MNEVLECPLPLKEQNRDKHALTVRLIYYEFVFQNRKLSDGQNKNTYYKTHSVAHPM